MIRQFNKLIEIGRALKPSRQDFRAFHVSGIFKGNRLIAAATNLRKTHPFAFKMGYPYASEGIHSECLAVIRGRLENYKNHMLIVIRLDNEGNVNYSKPCKYCEAMLKHVGFSNVYYSNKLGQIEQFTY